MQLGIPMLQNLIGHAKPSHHKKEHTSAVYHPTHSVQSDHVSPSSAALHHGQVAKNVGAQYHRMTSGNRGSK